MSHTNVIVTGCLAFSADTITKKMADRGLAVTFLDPIDMDDIDCGYAHIDNDVCVATAAIIGQYVRYIRQHETEGVTVLAPELCFDCRSACTASLLRSSFQRAGYDDVEVVELSCDELFASTPKPTDANSLNSNAPVVGVCGNIPCLITDEFNRVVINRLKEEGCHVVTPPLTDIANRKDFFTPAIEYFDQIGVTTVICVLPFGCLSGHVFARGQIRAMQKRFPHIGITTLDYDPSASDINLINRTELVIQSAKEHVG